MPLAPPVSMSRLPGPSRNDGAVVEEPREAGGRSRDAARPRRDASQRSQARDAGGPRRAPAAEPNHSAPSPAPRPPTRTCGRATSRVARRAAAAGTAPAGGRRRASRKRAKLAQRRRAIEVEVRHADAARAAAAPPVVPLVRKTASAGPQERSARRNARDRHGRDVLPRRRRSRASMPRARRRRDTAALRANWCAKTRSAHVSNGKGIAVAGGADGRGQLGLE